MIYVRPRISIRRFLVVILSMCKVVWGFLVFMAAIRSSTLVIAECVSLSAYYFGSNILTQSSEYMPFICRMNAPVYLSFANPSPIYSI